VYFKTPVQGEYVEAYETYAVVEESTTVVVAEDIDSSKEYKTAFGRNYDLKTTEGGELDVLVFDGEYNIVDAVAGETPYIPGSSAPKGTYIIYENKVVAFLRPGTAIASQILSITDFDGEKTYALAGVDNPIDAANITAYGGAMADDYVTYTMAGGQYVLSPVDPVKGTATKYATNADGEIVITVGGVAYPLFDEDNNTGLDADPAGLILSTEQYTFYITQDGKIVGWTGATGSSTDVNVDDIVYALGYFKLESKQGNYGEKVRKYYLQGVNTAGEEAHVLIAVEYDNNKDGTYNGEGDEATLGNVPETDALREGFYLTSDPENKDAKKEGIKNYVRIGVKDERNDATGNLFYGLNRWASTSSTSIVWPSSQSNNHVCTTACAGENPTTHNNTIVSGASNHSSDGNTDSSNKATRTFFGSDVRYVMIDGVLGEPLKTGAGDIDFKWTLPSGEQMKHPMLFKLNSVGATEVVMAVIRKDPDDLKASTSTIFVASSEPTASSAEGNLYTVYTASSGAKQEVVLHGTDGESAPAIGFWSYKVEDDGSWTQMYHTNDDEKLGYTGTTLKPLYIAGLFDGKTLAATFADGSSVPFITGANASSAKIVDLRSEAQKSAEGISTITSVEQLGNLAESGKLVSVYVYNKSSSTTGCIYVLSVDNNPTGVVYVTDPGTGAAITLDGKATSVTVNSGTLSAGFGRVEAKEGTVSFKSSTDAKYRYGELITSASGSTVNTEDIETGASMSLKINSKTVFVDTTALGINSMEELEDALEAGKKLTINCAAENGGNASLVIITGQGDPYLVGGDVVYVSATPDVGSVTADVVTGTKKGEAYTFAVIGVDCPTGIDGPGYYAVTKSAEGDISLTYAGDYMPAAGDVFFIPGTVSGASTMAEAYVIDTDSTELTVTQKINLVVPPDADCPSNFAAGYATGRFWEVNSEGVLTCIYNVTKSDGPGANRYGYHDYIYKPSTNVANRVILNDHKKHIDSGCGSGFAEVCGAGQSTSGSSTRKAYEVGPYLMFEEGTSVILDLRSVADSAKFTTLSQVESSALKGTVGNTVGLINTYSANAQYTSTANNDTGGYKTIAGTISVMVIVDQ